MQQLSINFAPDNSQPPPTPPTSTTVHDLDTGKTFVYLLPIKEALRAAYAQVIRRDFDTHEYNRKYSGLPFHKVGQILAIHSLYARESGNH